MKKIDFGYLDRPEGATARAVVCTLGFFAAAASAVVEFHRGDVGTATTDAALALVAAANIKRLKQTVPNAQP